jgi:hypothetical protein
MMPLEADADFQVLLLGLLIGGEDRAHAGCIDGERFFHEDIFPLPHGLGEMVGMKSLRARDEDEIGERDDVLISVESDELVGHRDVDLVGMLRLEDLQALVHPITVDVGHGHEFLALADVEVLADRAGPAAAATDHGDLDFVAARGMREAFRGECREGEAAGGGLGSSVKEAAAGEVGAAGRSAGG